MTLNERQKMNQIGCIGMIQDPVNKTVEICWMRTPFAQRDSSVTE